MAEVLSIIEHESIPIVDERKPGDRSIEAKHAQALSNLNTIPGNAYSWGHRCVKWSQYCGLVNLGDLTLEILPKIHGKESNPGACREALVRMLRKAGLFKIHKPGSASINFQKHTLLDIFIHDFCQQLNRQLVQGALRQYVSRDENLAVLKGKLLSHKQFRHNLAHKERLYCQYDELSEDILINQIIKYTLRLLLPKTRSTRIKNDIIQLLYAFDEVADRQVSSKEVDQLYLNRSENRFEEIIRLCSIFIQAINPGTGAGDLKSFSLMFDMNQLFESWVAAILKPLAFKYGWRLKEQGPKRFMAYRHDIDRPVFQMRPDISFIDQFGKTVLIVDTKWKLLAPDEAKLGISQADMYQMQAYGNRYGVRLLCLVYPKQSGCEGKYILSINGDSPSSISVNSILIESNQDKSFVSELETFIRGG